MASPNGIAQLPKVKPGRRGSLIQLCEMQRALYRDALSEEITATARAQVARAWCELEERKRVIRMKPAPKPVEVQVKPRGKRLDTQAAFSEAPPPAGDDPPPTGQ